MPGLSTQAIPAVLKLEDELSKDPSALGFDGGPVAKTLIELTGSPKLYALLGSSLEEGNG